MHVYSYSDLYNKWVQTQASKALNKSCIGTVGYRNIVSNYVTNLYTPNYFMRIAMGLFTIVSVVFAGLLFGVILMNLLGDHVILLLILSAIITYTVLELIIKKKVYFNAGVDNVLMVFAGAFMIGAFCVNSYANQALTVSTISLLLFCWMAIRFTDALMAMLAYISFLAVVFLFYIKLGTIGKATAPLVMMSVSAIAYFKVIKLLEDKELLFYHSSLKRVELLTLLSFYLSGNYYVIRELSNEMFNLNLTPNDSIPLGWLFWILTFAIPVSYIMWGIKRKDLLFVRTGWLMAVVSILTFKYYYSVMPAEVAMILGGGVLTAFGYCLTRYLKTPKAGFVFDKAKTDKETLAFETLLLIETTGNKELHEPQTQFGGGDFGGSGAGSKF